MLKVARKYNLSSESPPEIWFYIMVRCLRSCMTYCWIKASAWFAWRQRNSEIWCTGEANGQTLCRNIAGRLVQRRAGTTLTQNTSHDLACDREPISIHLLEYFSSTTGILTIFSFSFFVKMKNLRSYLFIHVPKFPQRNLPTFATGKIQSHFKVLKV